LKFCRTASLQQNLNITKFEAIEEVGFVYFLQLLFFCLFILHYYHFQIEFGSVYPNGQESNFCTAPHMKWLTIDCNCIFSGCSQPLPSFNVIMSSVPLPPQFPSPLQKPGVAIDLYDIQQAIFNAM
jgi:hypothetical protein